MAQLVAGVRQAPDPSRALRLAHHEHDMPALAAIQRLCIAGQLGFDHWRVLGALVDLQGQHRRAGLELEGQQRIRNDAVDKAGAHRRRAPGGQRISVGSAWIATSEGAHGVEDMEMWRSCMPASGRVSGA